MSELSCKVNLTAIDLFAGAGGMSYGLKKAGFNVLLANEIEDAMCQTYRHNHPETKLIHQDISKVNFKDELLELGYEKVDLVFGGPPCQGFSTLGKKDEYDDRNSLFWQFLRVVGEVNPTMVLFENVAGFKRMYGGKMHNALLNELRRLGYQTKESILDAKDYGVPQTRLRTIVVGYKSGFEYELPKKTQKKLNLWDAISDLPIVKNRESSTHYLSPPQNEYQKYMREGVNRLSHHEAPSHGESLLKMMSFVPKGGSIADVPPELRPKSYFANTYARLLEDEPAPTITRNFGTPSSSRCIHPFADRGLTSREGARLQSFPDSYRFFGSKSMINLQIGNAVPPLLALKIGENILKALQKGKSEHT